MTSLELIDVLFKKKNQSVERQSRHWSIQSCPGKVSVLKASPIREGWESPRQFCHPQSLKEQAAALCFSSFVYLQTAIQT